LDSAVLHFLNNEPPARSAIQAQILGVASSDDTFDMSEVRSLMSKSWFWHRATEEQKGKFQHGINTEAFKLQIYGFLQKTGAEKLRVTPVGKAVSRSTLSPLSAKLVIDNLARAANSSLSDGNLENAILALVGLPFEVQDNDELLKKVPLSSELAYVKSILKVDPKLGEKYQRVELCQHYAEFLRQWINGVPGDEILQSCQLDPARDSSLLETLPKDAQWILETILNMPISVLGIDNKQRDVMERLSHYCRFGSRNPKTIALLQRGLQHLRRETALRLTPYLSAREKNLESMEAEELKSLFPGRDAACESLYQEIRSGQA